MNSGGGGGGLGFGVYNVMKCVFFLQIPTIHAEKLYVSATTFLNTHVQYLYTYVTTVLYL